MKREKGKMNCLLKEALPPHFGGFYSFFSVGD